MSSQETVPKISIFKMVTFKPMSYFPKYQIAFLIFTYFPNHLSVICLINYLFRFIFLCGVCVCVCVEATEHTTQIGVSVVLYFLRQCLHGSWSCQLGQAGWAAISWDAHTITVHAVTTGTHC